jgi:hypothetical protein
MIRRVANDVLALLWIAASSALPACDVPAAEMDFDLRSLLFVVSVRCSFIMKRVTFFFITSWSVPARREIDGPEFVE